MAEHRILALDLAKNTGWAFGAASPEAKPRYGSVQLGKPALGHGSVGCGLEDWLWDFSSVHLKPTILVVEAAISGHRGRAAAEIALGLLMVCEMFKHRASIQLKVCAVSTVRARVIGTGRAKKPDVMAWCERQGYGPPDYDAADALALWELSRRALTGKESFPT